MRAIKYRELKRLHDNQGPRFMVKHLTEALKTGQLAPEDFSLNELYEACMGSEALRRLDPRKDDMILEFGGISGVDSTAFSNITGQLAISKVLEGYASPDFALTRMIGTVSTRIKDTEIIPGLTIMETPGHTAGSITVLVHGHLKGSKIHRVAIAGDALPIMGNFLKWVPPRIHIDPKIALWSMKKIIEHSEVIIPGHDKPFIILDREKKMAKYL